MDLGKTENGKMACNMEWGSESKKTKRFMKVNSEMARRKEEDSKLTPIALGIRESSKTT